MLVSGSVQLLFVESNHSLKAWLGKFYTTFFLYQRAQAMPNLQWFNGTKVICAPGGYNTHNDHHNHGHHCPKRPLISHTLHCTSCQCIRLMGGNPQTSGYNFGRGERVNVHQSLLRGSSPIERRWRCGAQGLMRGARGPFLPASSMVGFGWGCLCWPFKNGNIRFFISLTCDLAAKKRYLGERIFTFRVFIGKFSGWLPKFV